MAHLASTISTQGRWQEAEELQSQMVETVLKKPSVGNPDTLSGLANLASMYRDQCWGVRASTKRRSRCIKKRWP